MVTSGSAGTHSSAPATIPCTPLSPEPPCPCPPLSCPSAPWVGVQGSPPTCPGHIHPTTTPQEPSQGSGLAQPRCGCLQGLTLARLSRHGSSCHHRVLPGPPRGCSGPSPALAEQFSPQLGPAPRQTAPEGDFGRAGLCQQGNREMSLCLHSPSLARSLSPRAKPFPVPKSHSKPSPGARSSGDSAGAGFWLRSEGLGAGIPPWSCPGAPSPHKRGDVLGKGGPASAPGGGAEIRRAMPLEPSGEHRGFNKTSPRLSTGSLAVIWCNTPKDPHRLQLKSK